MDTNNELAQPQPEFSPLLKISEVARLLGLSPSMAYRLVQDGDLAAIRIGRAVRVRPQDLHSYVERNTVNSVDTELPE